MKKLLLFIALTIFGLGLNAQNVGDETTIDYDGYSQKFKITSVEPAECEVSDCTGEPIGVTIPSTVTISGTEFNVTSIGVYAFHACSSLTSIEIPNSVTSIGWSAFNDCSSLASIVIPNSVTSIGGSAFSWCSSLTSIVIPNSVTSIGSDAFRGCSSLTSIEIPNSVTSISNLAFRECSSLESITFGENSQLAYIGGSAFYSCSGLASIEIPNSVTYIGNGAFVGCSSLTSMIVAEGNTIYDSRENCNAIIETTSNTLIVGCQNTVIPNTVTSIGNKAFGDCSSLASIEIPSSVNTIGELAFSGCSGLASIEIPNSVTSIGYRAFENCSSLESVTFEENSQLTSIGSGAFSYCSSLTSIVIPNSVTSIGSEAFWDCSTLTSIEIPNSVTSIESYAFLGCSGLASIEIPNSVTFIGGYVFYGCSSLSVIKCYAEDVPQTGDAVFYNCPSDMTIYVPEVSLEEYKSASPWNAFTILPLVAVGPAKVSLDVVAMPYEVTITATPNEYAVEFHIGVTTKAVFDAEGLEKVIQMVRNDGHPEYEQMSATWVDGIVPGGEYVALGTAKNANDEWGETVVVHCTIPFGDVTPDNLVANVLSTSSIELTWVAVENALSYNVYQANELIANVEETTFTIDSLEYNTEYCYTVTAVRNETESDKSEEKCVKTLDLPITTPENLVAEALSTSSIILAWDNVENALSYNVYRDGEMIINVTNTNYTDKDLEYNTEYCYTVTAVRNETESDKSEEKCAKTLDLPITTPENLVAEALSTSSIILAWDNVENALSYNIYQSNKVIANVEETTFKVGGLEYNTEYCYTITAVRNETESDKSEEVCAKTLGESINELFSSINIYPNPVENELFIATEVRVEEIAIYDIYGRLCCRDASNASTSNSMDTFNVSVQDLEAGVYFVNVKTENGNIVKRFVKK